MLFNNCLVFLEVDENQHDGYGVSCDVQRMAKTVESLRISGNTLRIAFIRYNPHDFKVDGNTRKRSLQYRHEKLISLLREFETEPVGVEDLRTFYLFYDTDEDKPAIFSDEGYHSTAKDWLSRCIV